MGVQIIASGMKRVVLTDLVHEVIIGELSHRM